MDIDVRVVALIPRDDNGGGNTGTTEDDVKDAMDFAVAEFEKYNINVDFRIREIHNSSILNAEDSAGRYYSLDCESFHITFFDSSIEGVPGSEAGGEAWVRTSSTSTLVHEMGHLFGLVHTFNLCGGASREYVKINGFRWDCNNNSEQTCEQIQAGKGDFCCDTPADANSESCYSSGIQIFPNCDLRATNPGNDGCNDYIDGDDLVELVTNYMSYFVPSDCGDRKFSDEQKARMLAFIPQEYGSRIGTFGNYDTSPLVVLDKYLDRDLVIWDQDFVLGEEELVIENAVLTLVNCNVKASNRIVLKNGTIRLNNSSVSNGTCFPVQIDSWPGIEIEEKGNVYLYNNSTLENARIPISSSGGDAEVRIRANDFEISSSSRHAVDVEGWLDMRAYYGTINGSISSKVTGSINRGHGMVLINNSQINKTLGNLPAFDLMDSHLRLGADEINGFSQTVDSDESPRVRIVGCHLTYDGTTVIDNTSDNFLLFNNLIENGVVETAPSNHYSVKQNTFVSSVKTTTNCTRAICIGSSENSYNRFEGNKFNDNVRTNGKHSFTQFLCNVFESSPGDDFRWGDQVNPLQANNENGMNDDISSAGNLFSAGNTNIGGSSPGTRYFYDENVLVEDPVIAATGVTKSFLNVEPSPCGTAGISWQPPVLEIDPSPTGTPTPAPIPGPTVFIKGCPVGVNCNLPCPTGINCKQNCPPGINCLRGCPTGINCNVACPPGIDCTQPCPPGIDCTQPCPPGVDCTQPCPPGMDCTVPCYRNCNPCIGPDCDPVRPENDEVLQWLDDLYQERDEQIIGFQQDENEYLTQLIETAGLDTKEDILSYVLEDKVKPSKDQLLELFDKSELFTEAEMVSLVSTVPDNLYDSEVNSTVFYSESFKDKNVSLFSILMDEVLKSSALDNLLELDMLTREKSDLAIYALERLEIYALSNKLDIENLWLARLGGFSSDLGIVDNLFRSKDYLAMNTKLNSMISSGNLSSVELQDCYAYRSLMQALSSALGEGEQLNTLSDLSTLNVIALQGHRFSSEKAKSILSKFYGYEFGPHEDDVVLSERILFLQEETDLSSTHTIHKTEFGVYPNPSSGSFTVSNESSEKLRMQLFDVSGNALLEIEVADQSSEKVTTELLSGAYLYRLYTESGELLSVSKLIIID